jgi:hypothetical protein
LVECDRPGYPVRTAANVGSCDAVLWLVVMVLGQGLSLIGISTIESVQAGTPRWAEPAPE